MTFNPTKFPFYRLPLLALQTVIKSMELDVMFFFYLTSTKAKAVLKISVPNNSLLLDCSLWDEKRITLESPSNSNKCVLKFSDTVPDSYRSFQLQSVQFRYFTDFNRIIEIYGDEPLQIGVRMLLTHLADILQSPKISMDFQAVISLDVALELLNHVKNLNFPMVKIKLGTTNTPAEIYTAFLNEGPRITEALCMVCLSPAGFQYTPSEDFYLERFVVRDGFWVNIEDYINCKDVIIGRITYMNRVNAQRLNEFFKAWKTSSCRLERLVVFVGFSHGINFEEAIMGLNGTNITRDQLELEYSVDIERQDGKKATIRLTESHLTMKIKT